MNLVEFIGFIVSMLALGVLAYQKRKEEKLRRQNPEAYEHKVHAHERKLQEFLGKLHKEKSHTHYSDEEEGSKPQKASQHISQAAYSKKTLPKSFGFQPSLETHRPHTSIENRQLLTSVDKRPIHRDLVADSIISEEYRTPIDKSYSLKIKQKSSRVQLLVQRLPSRQQMMILHEIFSPPKGM